MVLPNDEEIGKIPLPDEDEEDDEEEE